MISQTTRERLLGSRWRDEHGNEYRIYSVHYTDDPEVQMQYVPPTHRKLRMSEVDVSFTLLEEGYEPLASPRKDRDE